MTRLSLLIACIALLAGPAFAQSTASDPAGFGGLAGEADEQINVSADLLEILENENAAIYTGNVVITQGTMQIASERVETIYGEGGPSDLQSFSASGGRVEMAFDDQTVQADTADYDFGDRVLVFTGSVVVVNASGTVNADRLVIDTRAGTSSFSSAGGGGRVTSTFTPGG
ncbi:LptA/OstA family protein [Pelagibacterium sp.]|uniref:LptA/OstA family protein n=1 Tax=Pelagibacterium sp. TaxID=1967288 RepID=UPI003A8CFC85